PPSATDPPFSTILPRPPWGWTVTAVVASALEAPSLSAAVTRMVKVSPLAGAVRYWCGAAEVAVAGVTATVCGGEPSPQLIVTVCVSRAPGPLTLPLRVTVPPASIAVLSRLSPVTAGATLLTVTLAEAEPLPSSSSVTVAVIAKGPVGWPEGLSRYWCDRVKPRTPAARATV